MATGTGITTLKDSWQNADGLEVMYSPKAWPSNVARATTDEPIRYAIFDVDLTKIGNGLTGYPRDLTNSGTTTGFNEGDFYLPAGSTVLRVVWSTTEIAAGGTSWTIGTYLQDGTIVDADSLMTATEAVLANADHLGDKIVGAGAYTAATAGTSGPGTANEFIAVYVTGTFTAGKGRVMIEYLDGATAV